MMIVVRNFYDDLSLSKSMSSWLSADFLALTLAAMFERLLPLFTASRIAIYQK